MLCAALDSGALTLGRMRGAAIVGQPLEVSIPVQLDVEESAASLCVEADVFHADARQDAVRVRVSVEALPQPQAASVRIFSSSPVDEPIVTVYLKVGCGQKSTRRYVLLADVSSETAAPAGATLAQPFNPAVPAQVALPVVPAAPAPLAAPVAGLPPEPVTQSAPASRRIAAEPPLVLRSEPRKAPAAKALAQNPETAAGKLTEKAPRPARQATADMPKPALPSTKPVLLSIQPRLKLDSLVMLSERVAGLESSPSVPVAEALRDSQKIQSLEADMKALVALTARNEANLMALQTRLQQAESERLPVHWFYGVMALLAGCLAAMVYFWRRPKASAAVEAPAVAPEGWWSGSHAGALAPAQQPEGPLVQASAPVPLAAAGRAPTSGPGALLPSGPQSLSQRSGPSSLRDEPESEVDGSLVEMSELNIDKLMVDKLMVSGQAHSALRRGPLPAAEISRPQSLQVEPVRSINSEEVFDIRQQAEFFVSLGQTDQAVRILENRIIDHGDSSPLIYLDLLAILHKVGLKSDFRQFREDFNLLFNSKVPEFASFRDEGKTLEDYPHVLAHIIALWPKPKVLMVIEASIFRDPWDDKSPPFELAAFRDLLLLHAIAQGIASLDGAASGPGALQAGKPAATANRFERVARFALGRDGAPVAGLQTRAGFSQVSAPAPLAWGAQGQAPAPSISLDLDLTLPDGPSLRLKSMPNRGVDFPSTMPGIGPVDGGAPSQNLGQTQSPAPSAAPYPDVDIGVGNGIGIEPDDSPALPLADDNFIDLIDFELPVLDDLPLAAKPRH